jgi:hypothetical protein
VSKIKSATHKTFPAPPGINHPPMAMPIAEFNHDNIRLLGTTLAGEESFIVAPELNLAFDIGRAPARPSPSTTSSSPTVTWTTPPA